MGAKALMEWQMEIDDMWRAIHMAAPPPCYEYSITALPLPTGYSCCLISGVVRGMTGSLVANAG